MNIKREINFTIGNEINNNSNMLLCLPSLFIDNKEYITDYSVNNYINDKYNVDYSNIDITYFLDSIDYNKYYVSNINLKDKDIIPIMNKNTLKYGYINLFGKEIIPCIYDDASTFINGIALVSKDGLYYYINKNNDIVKEIDNNNIFNLMKYSKSCKSKCLSDRYYDRINAINLLSSKEYIEVNGIVAYDIVTSNVYRVSDYDISYSITNNYGNISINSGQIDFLINTLNKLKNEDSKNNAFIKKRKR